MTKRPVRAADGLFHIAGKTFKEVNGSRKQVYNGTAYKTRHGLTLDKLHFNSKTGRIVSKKKHITAKKEQRLLKYGYGTQKGKFGYVRVTPKTRRWHSRRRRSMRGGAGEPEPAGNTGSGAIFKAGPAAA